MDMENFPMNKAEGIQVWLEYQQNGRKKDDRKQGKEEEVKKDE